MEIDSSMIDVMINFINQKYPNQKHDLRDILTEMFYILKYGIPWASWKDRMGTILGKTLYNHFCFFRDNHIFEEIYKIMLAEYLKSNKTKKLKYQSIDTTFIQNQYGIDDVKRNKYSKNKNVNKISTLVDTNGIPISVLVKAGNNHDCTFVEEQMANLLIKTNSINYKEHNRYKQYFLADTGYDSQAIRTLVKANGYTSIIPYNIRNTKNPAKRKSLIRKEKRKYGKRIIIENSFSWIKKNRRVQQRYDKSLLSYKTFLFLALIRIISKRIKPNL